ncbi:hypothetical protein [Ruegeria faecimaris]|uniref:hypothetical protein n=1 Tax=Ruegeria faecimaris TaxID=686389 RepID=UPI0024914D32|nr:hypothetical protein [Ruegeria faecimaris]
MAIDAKRTTKVAANTNVFRVTVLEASTNKPQTKVFHPGGVERSSRAKHFKPHEAEISGFDSLEALLAELAHEPSKVVVMGSVTEGCRNQQKIRRLANPRDGVPATLEDRGSCLLHFDVDDLARPGHLGWEDPAALARWAWSELCRKIPVLQDVSVFWQASSSAAIPGKDDFAKFHFWCLANRPLFAHERRFLFEHAGSDKSLAGIAQPNYTAFPIFQGVSDPLAGRPRSGVFRGYKDAVDASLIAFPIEAKKRRANPRQSNRRNDKGSLTKPSKVCTSTSSFGRQQLSKACKRIVLKGASNPLIFDEVQLVGGYVAGGHISYDEARESLVQAARAVGYTRADEVVENGLKTGLERPINQSDSKVATVPFYPAPTLHREEAIAKHAQVLEDWGRQALAYNAKSWQFTDDPRPETAPRVLLSGAQGVGKTAFLVGREGKSGFLHKTHGLVSLMLLPDHAKVQEALDDYTTNAPAGAPLAIGLRGRGQPDPLENEAKMCRVFETARHVSARGWSVRSSLCKRCPHQDTCGYLRQEGVIKRALRNKTGLIVFAPHEFGYLPLPGEAKPDLVIFDERPRDFAVESVDVTLEELGDFALPETRSYWSFPAKHGVTMGGAPVIGEHPVTLVQRALLSSLGQSSSVSLSALRAAGITSILLEQAIAALEVYNSKSVSVVLRKALGYGTQTWNTGDIARLRSRLQRLPIEEAQSLQFLFECLRSEIDSGHEEAVGVFKSGPDRHDPNVAPGLRAVRIKSLKHGNDIPFLYLDGTADPDLSRIAFGPDLACHHHPVERSAKIVQVVGCNFSKRRLCQVSQARQGLSPKIQEENQRLKAWVEQVIARQPDAAVFANNSVLQSLDIINPDRAGHFGALRGQNRWEGCPSALVIGREQPACQDIERVARAYAAATGDAFQSGEYTKVSRGIRLKGGVSPLEVIAHPDAWGDKILRQVREMEILQAMDRIRLIHNECPKNVYLLSPVVVDATVDRIEPWRSFKKGGTRIQRAIQSHDVVFLSPTDCAKFMPDIWASKQLAAQDLPTAKEMSKDPYRFIYDGGFDGQCPRYVTFRLKAENGRTSRTKTALVFTKGEEARTRLEALTGPLAEFRKVLES